MKKFCLLVLTLAFIASSCLLSSCKKGKCCSEGLFVQVYKTKADYSNNAFVFLSKNKKEIAGYYDHIDNSKYPITVYGDYYLDINMSGYAAFLSISIDEYNANNANGMSYTMDELKQMIIDDDPFTEFYAAVDNNNLYTYRNNGDGTTTYGVIDTAYIIQLIKEGDLKKEFDKIK